VPRENILVLTNQQQVQGVREALPDFPEENIIAEPVKRDTAPAIALAVGWVAARDPQATMMVLPSDHLIRDVAAFQRTLRTACAAAEESGALVTIGIKPGWACPSYGYVERGERYVHEGDADIPVYEVARFREKPSAELAEQFLAQGNFTWNAGMFFWKVDTVRKNLGDHCPELAAFVTALQECTDFDETVKQLFPTLPKLSIDYALMESVVSGTDSSGNLIFSQTGQHIALLGVHDLMVISTPDALLVAHRSQAESLKKLVDGLPTELR
jgi:mannose-1-phosphate guanylyltransferase